MFSVKNLPLSRIKILAIKHYAFPLADINNKLISTDNDESDKKRDISGLPKHLRNKMDHALRLSHAVKRIPKPSQQDERKFHRKLYAHYGMSSGINPGIMWPPKEQLQILKEDENEWEPDFSELVENMREEKQKELEERLTHEQHVATQMEKMPQYIENYKLRLKKIDEEQKKQGDSVQQLLEDAREFYGYNLEKSDPRFTQYVQSKTEEEKIQKKKEKKKKKHQELTEGLEKNTAT